MHIISDFQLRRNWLGWLGEVVRKSCWPQERTPGQQTAIQARGTHHRPHMCVRCREVSTNTADVLSTCSII